jgi:hypothetical protein
MSDPAAAVLRLAEAERALAAEGAERAEDLAAVQDARDAAIAALPPTPSPAQAALLRQALRVHQEAAALLRAAREEILAELYRLDQGRATVRGYAPADAAASRSFDAAA